MKIRTTLLAALLSCLLFAPAKATPIMIGFEEIPAGGQQTFGNGFQGVSQGFVFFNPNPERSLNLSDSGQIHIPKSGSSRSLMVDTSLGGVLVEPLEIFSVTGRSFDLQSIRVAELINVQMQNFDSSATTITLEGFFADGGSIVVLHTLDLFAQGNHAKDFELLMPAGFRNLSKLVVTGSGGLVGSGFMVDDITLQYAVPLPAAFPLFLFGVAGLNIVRNRRTNRT